LLQLAPIEHHRLSIVDDMTHDESNLSVASTRSAESARGELERLILAGELGPGERLNELALAARLGVSRAHLREAVRSLEEARLIDVVANRGARVRKLEFGEALELFEVRAGLARSAGRLAVQRATRAQIRVIQDVHRDMIKAAERGQIGEFHSLNLRFHALMFESAANARLREMDLAVRNEMQLYIRSNVSSATQLKLSCAEHGAIVSALVDGDDERCGKAFETHILNGKKRLMDGAPPAR
jgi:DNA-binding GntR family transcriptional regulator